MRGLLALIAAFCLFAGLANGAIAHAMELAAHSEVAATGHAGHFDGDADQVPADGDKPYPHHHNVCHGHELAAPFKLCGGPRLLGGGLALIPGRDRVLASGPPGRALRPPIA